MGAADAPAKAKRKASSVSAGYIRHLLHKRTAENAKSARKKVTTRLRKSKKSTASSTNDSTSGGKTRRTRKRRYRRKRRATTTRAASATTKPEPVVESRAEVAVDRKTTSFAEQKPHTETKVNIDDVIEEREKSWDNFVASLSSRKPSCEKKSVIVDVITLSDEDDKMNVPGKRKPENGKKNKKPEKRKNSTASRPKQAKRRSGLARVIDSSDSDRDYHPGSHIDHLPTTSTARSDSDYQPESEDDRPSTSRPKSVRKNVSDKKSGSNIQTKVGSSRITTVSSGVPVQCVAELLFIPPVARAIAKSLPMRSLLSLAQVNRELHVMCEYERTLGRRQIFDWIHLPSIITALNHDVLLHEKDIFGNALQELYCEPEIVICFSTPKVMFGHQLRFDNPKSPDYGHTKNVHMILSDLLPKSARKIVHIRTVGVLPPIPSIMTGNPRKVDHWGCKSSARDLSILAFPKIAGVNIWREHLSESELRSQLKHNGWLENRSHNHFLLPMIKELEIVSPKLVIMFTRRFAHHKNVISSEFPVLVLNTMDGLEESTRYSSHGDPSLDYGLEWLAFGGNDTVAYQVALEDTDGDLERTRVLRHLRDQFTAQQVMGGKMLLFYFHNADRLGNTSTNIRMDPLFAHDVKQLREEFPRVPVLGGAYPTVIGSIYTKDKADGNFGKFFSGSHTAFACAMILGQ